MLDLIVGKLEEGLSRVGVITNILLKTERSAYEVDEEETREVDIYFLATEQGWDFQPMATIHLFLIDDVTCEMEAEIRFKSTKDAPLDATILWERASAIVPSVSYSVNKRWVNPDRLVEDYVLLDFHFVLTAPESPQERQAFDETMERFATDLGELVRLSTLRAEIQK